MYLIVVGGGAVGRSLLEIALKLRHDIVLIEPEKERAERAAETIDALVLNAPITEEGIMEEARVERADALIATTGDDSTNLMAMVLAREYGVQRLVSIVNQVDHRRLFEHLGVHVLVDPEVLVARHLLDIAMHPRAKDVAPLGDEEQLFQVSVSASSKVLGKSYPEIANMGALPPETFIVAIERDQHALRPSADIKLRENDVVIIFTRLSLSEEDLEVFTGEG
jgi:trk system potassium uptake protein TrkA